MTSDMIQMTPYMVQITKNVALLGLTILIWGMSAMMIVLVVTYIRDLFR